MSYREEHKFMHVKPLRLRKLIVQYAHYRVMVSRDGGPEVEYSKEAAKQTGLRLCGGVSVDTEGLDFFMAMEFLYRWMAEANVLITPDGIIHIKAYSELEK